MIDLHTHTFFSDGELIPSELVYRAKVQGYEAIGLTDHGDFSTFDFTIPRIVSIAEELTNQYKIKVIPGVELTYVPPPLISKAVKICRRLGAKLIVVHGETPAETVPPGTNKAGILAGADILAHPGYLSEEDAVLAGKNNVYLEITSRQGHNKTNRHVAVMARRYNAEMVINSDTHAPENLLTNFKIKQIVLQSGLKNFDRLRAESNALKLINKIYKK